MNEQDLFRNMLAPQQPETHEAATAEEVAEYFSFADGPLGVDWGDEGVPKEYTPDYIAANPDKTRVFTMHNDAGELIAGAKVKMLLEKDQEELGLDKGIYAGKKGALMEYTLVRKDERDKGLLSVLTEKRAAWAKERGAAYACTEIELGNSVSAHTKTRDGFMFVGVNNPGRGIAHPYLVAVRPSDETLRIFPENAELEEKTITITPESKPELEALFRDGWIGVDAKKPEKKEKGEEPADQEASPWTLVIRRAKTKDR